MSSEFLAAIQTRRTNYQLTRKSPISEAKIKEILETAVKHTPSSFNSQSSRAVLLFGAESDKLWEIVKTHFVASLGGNQDMIALYSGKIAEYAAGYGTVIFFEDQAVIKASQERNPAMAANFPIFSENSTGMLQFVVWTALATEGLAASLQHYGGYTKETDPAIQEAFGLPATWRSTAIMPFGTAKAEPGPKTFDLSNRIKVFGSNE